MRAMSAKMNKVVAVVVFGAALASFAGLEFALPVKVAIGNFIGKVQKSDIKGAYEDTSAAFKSATTLGAFTAFTKRYNLQNVIDYEVTKSKSGQLKGIKGKEVIIRLKWPDQTARARTTFVKNFVNWQLNGITMLDDVAAKQSAKPVSQVLAGTDPPTEKQAIALARQTWRAFLTAIDQGSMKSFIEHASVLVQSSWSVDTMDKAFLVPYRRYRDSISSALTSKLNLKSIPTVDNTGRLVVDGVFASQPTNMGIKATYMVEGASWKLTAFAISTN